MTHHHHHEHHGEQPADLSFEERMVKLLDHWVRHNDDHAGSYRDWAAKAQDGQMPQVAELLRDAADLTMQISERFQQAVRHIRHTHDHR